MKNFTQLLFTGLVAINMAKAGLVYNANAILNPGAETGTPSTDGVNGGTVIPNWTVTGNFHAVIYGAPSGFPLLTDPGPASRGRVMFGGGPSNASSKASQLLDVSNVVSDIDTGLVGFALEGYLGGFLNQEDNAVLLVTFQDNATTALSSVKLGPVTASDRGNATGLFLRTTSGFIPTGTRSILFELEMTRTAGSYNDGYADNLSFVASAPPVGAVPEPSSAMLMLAGLAVPVALRMRRG